MLFPIVFQCGRCKNIIGDSTHFHCSDETIQICVLDGATSVKVLPNIASSEADTLSGRFRTIQCSKCLKTLGRQYVTVVNAEYAFIIGKYTFFIANIISYEVGKVSSSESPRKSKSHREAHEGRSDIETIQSINAEIDKIQHVLLNVIERLQTIEDIVISKQHSESEDDIHTKRSRYM